MQSKSFKQITPTNNYIYCTLNINDSIPLVERCHMNMGLANHLSVAHELLGTDGLHRTRTQDTDILILQCVQPNYQEKIQGSNLIEFEI